MPKPAIFLYAEALTHIRQLNLHASLETEKNEHTKILLSSDKSIITALHDGESSSIYLPTQISGTANVTFPTEKRTEMSARLQIEDVDQLTSSNDDSVGIEVPWSATDLQENASIRCKWCDSCIVSAGKITTWKDLPSDHWADLMDLWFCHRPHHGNTSPEQAVEAKGSFSGNDITATPGVGLVDIVSWSFSRQDCANLKEASTPVRNGTCILECAKCDMTLGSCSKGENSCRIYKSRTAVVPSPGEDSEKFSAAIFVAAQLLVLIDNSVSRRIVVREDHHDESKEPRQGLLLWVFNPDIYYSSSKRGPTVHRAMKIFYQALPDPEKFVDDHPSSHEELVIPTDDFVDFQQTLQESTDILPQSARTFQEWHVGLLDRWEKHATGSARMDQNPLNKKVEDGFELFSLPAGMRELYL